MNKFQLEPCNLVRITGLEIAAQCCRIHNIVYGVNVMLEILETIKALLWCLWEKEANGAVLFLRIGVLSAAAVSQAASLEIGCSSVQ
jgi:hypothetical protein